MEIEIVNNEKHSRFEAAIEGKIAHVDYRFDKGDIILLHTFVPESLRGKGIASALAKLVLEYIKEHKLKAVIYCPTIAKYIKQHPEYEVLVDKEYTE